MDEAQGDSEAGSVPETATAVKEQAPKTDEPALPSQPTDVNQAATNAKNDSASLQLEEYVLRLSVC